jgi:hypothetical protein
MTTQNTNPVSNSSLVLAGAAAEGHGALAGWRGQGGLTRAAVLEALVEAGLPADWAPASKRDVGHAGAIMAGVGHGLIARRADAATWSRSEGGTKVRPYRARWVVARNRADAVEGLGAALGDVVLIAELRDDSDELHVEATQGAQGLAASLLAEYRAARDAEVYASSDVTEWLRLTLARQCGAVRYSTGLYVPRQGRDVAERLVAAVSSRWGVDWTCPLLPVATSEQLAVGLARGMDADVTAIESDLATERADALARRKQTEVSPTVAARLLLACTDLDARLDRMAPLCGEHLAPVRVRLRALVSALQPLVGADVQRFALLELDGPVDAPARMPARRAPASVAADRALERRRVEQAASVEIEPQADPGWVPEGVRTWVAELAAMRAGVAAPAHTGPRDVLLAAGLDEQTDAGRLVREIVAQIDDGRAESANVRQRLGVMVESAGPRWSAAAREVLAVLDGVVSAAA